MPEINVGSNNAASIQQLQNLNEQLQDGDHLRMKKSGDDVILYSGKDANHNTSLPGGARRVKFTGAKNFVRNSVASYLKRGAYLDYDKADQAKAREISHQYLKRRLAELKAGKRNVRTHRGQ